ncbi:MAG: pitrilysin family protein [bacterium]
MNKTHIRAIVVTLVLLAIAATLAFSQSLEQKVKVHKLKNGFTVIFIENHDSPTFFGVYGFKVGAVDEPPGITGTAHLFEHMAFKGTPKIGTSDFQKEKPIMEQSNKVGRELSQELVKGPAADKEKVKRLSDELLKLDKEQKQYVVKDEIDQIYAGVGGTGLNASTGNDVTQYIISLPSNRFELYCLVESERMKNAVLREFYTERSVIQEERKQTTDASPARMLSEMFMASAFMAHQYNHPVVGWASDINSVTLEEATAFKQKYYTPNNCVLAIAGDVYPEKAIPLIEQYFSDWPRGDDPPLVRTVEPKQLGERRVKYEADAEPQLMIGFHKPTFPHKDDAVLSSIATLLSSGRTSIFYKDLVRDKQLAANVMASATYPGSRYDNLFVVMGSPRNPNTNETLEKAIMEHLEKLKTEPVSEKELQKVKNNLEANYLRAMQSNRGLASTLLRYQLLFDDWKLYLKSKEMISAVTPQNIMECAKKYFTSENKTVGYLIKKSK